MITPPARASIWLAAGVTDMRKGMPGLAALVRSSMDTEPLNGDVFVFRGRRDDLATNLCTSRLSTQRAALISKVTVAGIRA